MTTRPPIRIGLIGGTGLGDRLHDELEGTIEEHDGSTPFGPTSSPVVTGRIGACDVAILLRHGRGHVFNPTHVPYRANVFALKAMGCTHVIASGATGSLHEDIDPGDVVLCDQIIDRTVHRPRTFFEDLAVHVELADPCCPGLRDWLGRAGADVEGTVHRHGTYVCMEGPAFSTRAESRMHRGMGAHVVGMTAMPEARLAREAELGYALVALPTDWDAWRDTGEDSVLETIIRNLERSTEAAMGLLRTALSEPGDLLKKSCPAHHALDNAVWTDPSLIEPDVLERLQPLLSRRFDSISS
jgi:5'-methylthioadenosine phosphorylase